MKFRNLLRVVVKSLYTAGSVGNAILAVTIPNPISTPVLVSQVLGAVFSSKISDNKTGVIGKAANLLGHNFDEASNDVNYYNR